MEEKKETTEVQHEEVHGGGKELTNRRQFLGAFAGIVGAVGAGIVGVPVIAVPTSIGYGASLGGFSALLSMLNSCSTVATFNIDNGFGAAYFATLVNRL